MPKTQIYLPTKKKKKTDTYPDHSNDPKSHHNQFTTRSNHQNSKLNTNSKYTYTEFTHTR